MVRPGNRMPGSHMKFASLLLVLLSCSTVCHAQNMSSHPAKLDDKAALDAALADIGTLSERQTEALARALANCWDGVAARSSSVGFEACAQSHRYLLYITNDEGPMRQVYDAWYVERAFKGTKGDRTRTLLANAIENAFSDAIRKRFDVLEKDHK
jgi:hypothetical protein